MNKIKNLLIHSPTWLGDIVMSMPAIYLIKEKYKDSLVIFTTHNTNLMSNKIMRPDTLFILSTSGKLTPLCKATDRELRLIYLDLILQM